MRTGIMGRGLLLFMALSFGGLIAFAACSGSEDGDATTGDATTEVGSDWTETAGNDASDTGEAEGMSDDAIGDGKEGDPDSTDSSDDDGTSTPELVANLSIEESGCVGCHTDKDTMVALAPTEEVAEASGGG